MRDIFRNIVGLPVIEISFYYIGQIGVSNPTLFDLTDQVARDCHCSVAVLATCIWNFIECSLDPRPHFLEEWAWYGLLAHALTISQIPANAG